MNIYWGDIHNHCGITYGFGSLENALKAAREQLDFCAIIGHAMWPDIPEMTPALKSRIEYHQNGFKKLRQNWETVRQTVQEAHVPHEFVTFQGYEMHSRKYGDYHLLSPSDKLPLLEADSPAAMVANAAPEPAIAILHHPGYTPGYRGANWQDFSPDVTPVVEVYSKHGCSMSDSSIYPYLHTMGPRDGRSTIYNGLRAGHTLGFVASTDHHAGYPGSYGDGRVAVLAKENTREAIWEAILARRTYAITGDKIQCDFTLNGADFGSVVPASEHRRIVFDTTACDQIDKIVLYKNLKPWRVVNGETLPKAESQPRSYKVRVEFGWGKPPEGLLWKGQASIRDGVLASAESCFRGRSVLSPEGRQDDPAINDLENSVIEKTDTQVTWQCRTFKNPTTMHSQTGAMILEIQGDQKTSLLLDINGKQLEISIGDLLLGSRSFHLQAYNSEAVLVHRAIPETQYCFHGEWEDRQPESDRDFYHVELRQMNQQMAWISPIFVNG